MAQVDRGNGYASNNGASQSVDTANMILLVVNDNEAVGRAQTMDASSTFGTRNLYEVGTIMPVESDFLRFTGTLNMNRIRLHEKSLEHAGLVGLGEDILATPIFTVNTMDRYTGTTEIAYRGCSAISFGQSYRANDFVRETARFYYLTSTAQDSGYKPKYKVYRKIKKKVI